MSRKVRWGILSCAGIADRAFIPGVKNSKTGVVVAVSSRNLDKAKAFAEKHGVDKAYGSYEELLQDPDIDAVYIPLPNQMHAEWTMKAAEAKKHVLCEKPLTTNEADAVRSVEACRKYGVLLGEAFMYRHHPRYDAIKEIIRSGEIGEIRGIHSLFTFDKHEDTGNVKFVNDLGGGSIYDVGCYPISSARYLLEKEPEAATVQAFFSEQHDNVDMFASGLLEFPGSVSLTFQCGMWAERKNSLLIVGSKGYISMESAFSYDPSVKHFQVCVAGKIRDEAIPEVDHYMLEIDEFGRSILEGKNLRFPAEDAILNMRAIDACLRSARERRRVELS